MNWFGQNWQSWLASGTWWQSLASICQALFAVLLYKATERNIALTKAFADAQNAIVAIEKQNQKAAVYERRFLIYEHALGAIYVFTRGLQVHPDALGRLGRAMIEAKFLMPGAAYSYLVDYRSKSAEYMFSHQDVEPGVARSQADLNRKHQLQQELSDTAILDMVFTPYFDVWNEEAPPPLREFSTSSR